MSDDPAPDQPSRPPLLRVVRGAPDPAELAAVVAVVAARSSGAGAAAPRPLTVWSARSRLVRPPLRPGPGAWRASAWPR